MTNQYAELPIKMARTYWSLWDLWLIVVFGLAIVVMSPFISQEFVGDKSLAMMVAGAGFATVFGAGVKILYMRVYSQYVIMEDRIDTSHGVFSKHNTSIYMEHIRSVDVNKSFMGMLMGYGDLLIGTSGTGENNIKMVEIDTPQDIQQLILDIRDGKFQQEQRERQERAEREEELQREEEAQYQEQECQEQKRRERSSQCDSGNDEQDDDSNNQPGERQVPLSERLDRPRMNENQTAYSFFSEIDERVQNASQEDLSSIAGGRTKPSSSVSGINSILSSNDDGGRCGGGSGGGSCGGGGGVD